MPYVGGSKEKLMTKNFYISIFTPIILSIFISIFFIPLLNSYNTFYTNDSATLSSSNGSINFSNSSNNLLWPTPGYSRITSKFGYRNAPAKGSSTYHGGIDIGVPEGTNILSILDGTVTYAGWYGANGYSIVITHSETFKSIYGHISPDFLVSVGDVVKRGDKIAKVGPKYIPKKSYTTYQDSSGKYTNGATTRSTFTLIHC